MFVSGSEMFLQFLTFPGVSVDFVPGENLQDQEEVIARFINYSIKRLAQIDPSCDSDDFYANSVASHLQKIGRLQLFSTDDLPQMSPNAVFVGDNIADPHEPHVDLGMANVLQEVRVPGGNGVSFHEEIHFAAPEENAAIPLGMKRFGVSNAAAHLANGILLHVNEVMEATKGYGVFHHTVPKPIDSAHEALETVYRVRADGVNRSLSDLLDEDTIESIATPEEQERVRSEQLRKDAAFRVRKSVLFNRNFRKNFRWTFF